MGKNNNVKQDNTLEVISLIISIVSVLIAFGIGVQSWKLQKEYERLNSYSSSLDYTVEISRIKDEGKINFDGKEINTGRIDVTPKIGGISKVYGLHYYKNNIKAILPIELYRDGLEKTHNAHDLMYGLDYYTLDCLAEDDESLFSTLFLVVEDYQHNYYTNMIVYEIDKENLSKIEIRVYTEIDLLYCYNEDMQVLPEYDSSQLLEYKSLLEKLSAVLQ